MLINNNCLRPNISIERTDQTIILDHDGVVLIFGIASMSRSSDHNLTLIVHDIDVNSNMFMKFFEEYRANLFHTGPVSMYKKTVKAMMKGFSLTMYGAFISTLNYNTNNILEIELCYDHEEYNIESSDYDNYIVHLRKDKIQRIRSRMKKESECLERHEKKSEY